MKLRDLIDGLGMRLIGDPDVDVKSVSNDSREIESGDVYVAVRGIRADGHAFVDDVIAKGVAAIVVEREQPNVKVPQIIVEDGAVALGQLVARTFGDPAKAMTLVGITGTNGKTTTSYLLESILTTAGYKTGVIGTVSYRWPGGTIDAPYTTPTPQLLHGALAKMRDAGCTHVVMEVTSFALSMRRVAGMKFAVAGFSNLTQDHLDVHGTMEVYRDAKRKLFTHYLASGGAAVVNVDDPEGVGMAEGCPRILRVTAKNKLTEIRAVDTTSSVRGITGTIVTPTGEIPIEAKPLLGHYNVENLALAVGICEALGLPHETIERGIRELRGVPGRVERVPNDADLDIIVDYAHTPDALRNVLTALRPLTAKRLICVFGCGGDRDPTKRPRMGAEVVELADLAIVTSDNPRTEEPRSIIDQILVAVPKPFFVDVDRRTAIRAAVSEATPGDVVVIAGKGHEDYQILGTTKHHFDDREEAKAAVFDRFRRTHVALADDCGGALRAGRERPSIPATRDSMPGSPLLGGYCTRVVIDSRIAAKGDLYVAVRGEAHDGHQFCAAAIRAGATAVLVDKDDRTWAPVEPTMMDPSLEDLREDGKLAAGVIVVDDTRLAIASIAHGHRTRWNGKLVAVTGSAGKTTTKELIRAALGAAGATHGADGSLNNETGVPLTLLGLRPFHAYGVVEMGMRGKGQIEHLTKTAEPDVAVVINAGSAHIELLGSTDAIAAAKAEIWMGLRDGGTIVRPVDDERLERHAREHRPRARHVTFGSRIGTGGASSNNAPSGADIELVAYTPLDTGSRITIEAFGARHDLDLHLVGSHVALDACAALAAAHAAGASIEQAIAGLARARPPAMRGEVVEVGKRKIIVDCYNANPASMAAALRALAERAKGLKGLAVLGDMRELGEHAPRAHAEIGALATKLGLGVIAIGDHAKTVVEAAGGDAECADDPAAAAKRAFDRTSIGDWILLKASRGMRLERVLDAMREATE
jgi:murE/murF fusion protein